MQTKPRGYRNLKKSFFCYRQKRVKNALQAIPKGELLVTCQKHASNLLRACFRSVRSLLLTCYEQTGHSRPFKQAPKRVKKEANQLPPHARIQPGNEPAGNLGIRCKRYRVYRKGTNNTS